MSYDTWKTTDYESDRDEVLALLEELFVYDVIESLKEYDVPSEHNDEIEKYIYANWYKCEEKSPEDIFGMYCIDSELFLDDYGNVEPEHQNKAYTHLIK